MSTSQTSWGAIEWRDSEIQDAVDFLAIANPKGYSVEDIKRHVLREFDGAPTFVGTAGWYVTIVRKNYESNIPFIALVSIMPYTAKNYAMNYAKAERK